MKYILAIIALALVSGCEESNETNISVDADDGAVVQIDSDGTVTPNSAICSVCDGFDYDCETCGGDGLE